MIGYRFLVLGTSKSEYGKTFHRLMYRFWSCKFKIPDVLGRVTQRIAWNMFLKIGTVFGLRSCRGRVFVSIDFSTFFFVDHDNIILYRTCYLLSYCALFIHFAKLFCFSSFSCIGIWKYYSTFSLMMDFFGCEVDSPYNLKRGAN